MNVYFLEYFSTIVFFWFGEVLDFFWPVEFDDILVQYRTIGICDRRNFGNLKQKQQQQQQSTEFPRVRHIMSRHVTRPMPFETRWWAKYSSVLARFLKFQQDTEKRKFNQIEFVFQNNYMYEDIST